MFGDGCDLLRCLLSGELQRDVQRLRTNPARLGSKTLDAFKEARNSGANVRVKIDADKYSHLLWWCGDGPLARPYRAELRDHPSIQDPYKSARRIISNAC